MMRGAVILISIQLVIELMLQKSTELRKSGFDSIIFDRDSRATVTLVLYLLKVEPQP